MNRREADAAPAFGISLVMAMLFAVALPLLLIVDFAIFAFVLLPFVVLLLASSAVLSLSFAEVVVVVASVMAVRSACSRPSGGWSFA